MGSENYAANLRFAKHPALFSLAEIAIIGMVIVVLMTFYLPPLVFRWLTTKKGSDREVPITIERIVYSLWAISFFLFFSLTIFGPYALFHTVFLSKSRRCRSFFHKILQLASRFVIYRVPGVEFKYINNVQETLTTPSVIICNHQSHLDVMCILMMSPKIVILTNDWVWKNPFYGSIIRAAEFYPISDGMDKNIVRLRTLVSRGYSVVVFPEGTRTNNRSIMHFHQGAFALAKELKVDILPLMIHGLSEVLPKHDFMLRRGRITLEVFKRMHFSELDSYTNRELTMYWHKWYEIQYEQMCHREEDIFYWLPYIKYCYLYKSYGVERNSKKAILDIINNPSHLSQYLRSDDTIVVNKSGQGEKALLLALLNPNKKVFGYEQDPELFLISRNLSRKPKNLLYINRYESQMNYEQESCNNR